MNVIAQSVIQFHYMKYMYFFKVKYTKLCNVLQKNYRAQHKLLVNTILVSPMSALACMTGLTGWLQLLKQTRWQFRALNYESFIFRQLHNFSFWWWTELFWFTFHIVPKTSATIWGLRNMRPNVCSVMIFQLLNFIMVASGSRFR